MDKMAPNMVTSRWWAILALLLALFTFAPAAEARRVALVVANGTYAHAGTLKNPPNDARLVARSLEEAGFDQVNVLVNLGKTQMEVALREFSELADGADVALIYYAGHGMEVGGQNYLIPADARLARDRDLEVEGVRLDTAMLMVEGARLKIVILDACRNNPFVASMAKTSATRSVGRGLAAVEPEGETLVVYAAKAGATAADGSGVNSPFASALAKRITEPGLEISLLFRAVRDDVMKVTGRSQEPFTYGSLSSIAFYFVPPAQSLAIAPSPVTISDAASEALFWQGTLNANSAAAYRDYLARYPAGTYATLARENVARLAAPAPFPVATQTAPVAPVTGTSSAKPTSNMPGLTGLPLSSFSAMIARPEGGMVTGGRGKGSDARAETAALVRSMTFRPSSALRQQIVAEFFAQLEANDPATGPTIRALFQQVDVFVEVDRAVAKYGLNTSNLADTTAIMLDTLRDAALGKISEPTPAQAVGLRNQLAHLLALNPEQLPRTDAERQRVSDNMILSATVIAFALDTAISTGDPATLKQFTDSMGALLVQELGVDLRTLRLTDKGYVR